MAFIDAVSAGAPQGMPRQIWNIGGSASRPSLIICLANQRWPVSNTSSSGFTPSSWIRAGALAQIVRRGDVDHVAVAEIQRAAIERADLRQQLLDMGQALDRADHIGRRAGLGRLVVAHFEIAAHAGGEIDHHVGVAAADALDHFAVELDIAAALAGLGIAHMAMGDGGARLGRLDRRVGDLLRRDRNCRMLAHGVAGAGDGAGDDDFIVHGNRLPRPVELIGPAGPRLAVRPLAPWCSAAAKKLICFRQRPDKTRHGKPLYRAFGNQGKPAVGQEQDRLDRPFSQAVRSDSFRDRRLLEIAASGAILRPKGTGLCVCGSKRSSSAWPRSFRVRPAPRGTTRRRPHDDVGRSLHRRLLPAFRRDLSIAAGARGR